MFRVLGQIWLLVLRLLSLRFHQLELLCTQSARPDPGAEILVAPLGAVLCKARGHLFMWWHQAPEGLSQELSRHRSLSRFWRHPEYARELLFLTHFFVIGGMCFSLFSSRNVLKAQCFFVCLFKSVWSKATDQWDTGGC